MFQRKRRLAKENKNYSRKLFLGVTLLIAGLSILSAVVYYSLSLGQDSLLNPLSKERNSFETQIKSEVEKVSIKTDSVSLNSDGSVTAKLDSGGEVIFAKNKAINSQIASLQLLLSRLTIEGKKLKSLDFRFASPVVSFN